MANMGEIELRLFNEAVSRRQNGQAVLNKERGQLTITEARSLLSREEQIRIREQARGLAWEQITPPEVFSPNPDESAVRLSDTIAHLQEDTQQRARLAHKVLDEFAREKIGLNGKNGTISTGKVNGLEPTDSQRLNALEDYAARMREELYRGFESLDVFRRELEQPRSVDVTERSQLIESNSHSAPDRNQIFPTNGLAVAEDKRFSDGGDFPSDRDSIVDESPDDRDGEPWQVDSNRKWHFDSIRDLAEPLPVPTVDHTIERDHDFSLDR